MRYFTATAYASIPAHAAFSGVRRLARIRPQAHHISAIVLLDPVDALLNTDGLAYVHAPVLVFRPDRADVLRQEGNAGALAAD